MFRLKIIFGDKLSTRLLETQSSQALIRCLALNKINSFGFARKLPGCLSIRAQLDRIALLS